MPSPVPRETPVSGMTSAMSLTCRKASLTAASLARTCAWWLALAGSVRDSARGAKARRSAFLRRSRQPFCEVISRHGARDHDPDTDRCPGSKRSESPTFFATRAIARARSGERAVVLVGLPRSRARQSTMPQYARPGDLPQCRAKATGAVRRHRCCRRPVRDGVRFEADVGCGRERREAQVLRSSDVVFLTVSGTT